VDLNLLSGPVRQRVRPAAANDEHVRDRPSEENGTTKKEDAYERILNVVLPAYARPGSDRGQDRHVADPQD
jgi:hypothetical protein